MKKNKEHKKFYL